jgi:F-type H+-transporting ATPase subunit delta
MSATRGARTVAVRYARAFFAVVLDRKGDLDRAGKELSGLAGLLEREQKFLGVLSSPAVPLEKRVAVLERVLASAKPAEETVNLARLLTTNERIGLVGEVAQAYRRLVLEHRRIQPGEVTSAQPLTDAQRRRLAESLGKALGKTMELTYRTDPELVGGVVVRLGNRVYDASVMTQLRKFKETALSGALLR